MNIAVRNRNYHTATENREPYGITKCYPPPGSGDFSGFTPAEAGIQFSDPRERDARLSWPRWWLHPKIANLPKTVTYLRNNQAVSWLGLEPATQRSQGQRPNHHTTKPSSMTTLQTKLYSLIFRWLSSKASNDSSINFSRIMSSNNF